MPSPKRIALTLAAALLCVLAALPATAGARTIRTAAIVFHFENHPPQVPGPGEPVPNDPIEAAEAVLFGTGPITFFPWDVRQYFKTVTYGVVDYSGTAADIYGPYEIGPYAGTCQFKQWTNEAEAEAAVDGFDPGDYDQVAHYLEPSADEKACAYGIGSVGYAFMKGVSDYLTLHEFAHGLTATKGHPGSPHAGTLRCTEGSAPVPYSAKCVADETGDPFDPMGLGRRGSIPLEPSAWRKLNFGAISAKDAPTITRSGTYSIAPLEKSGGIRLLRVPSGDGRFFDLDFRRSIGAFDGVLSPSEPVTNGVAIHLDPRSFNDPGFSQLLDTNPGTASFDDAPLAAGRQFRDFRTGTTIETLSTGPNGATVKIEIPGSETATKPRRCKVPNLKRKKVRAARKSLRKRACKVGKVKRRHSKKVPKGKVISQRPKAGKSLKAGSKVSVVVSSGPKPKPKRR